MLSNILNSYRKIGDQYEYKGYYAFLFPLILISLALLITFGPSPWLALIFFSIFVAIVFLLVWPPLLLPFIIVGRALAEAGREVHLPWMNQMPILLGIFVIGSAFIVTIYNLRTLKKSDYKIITIFLLISLVGIYTSKDVLSIQGFGKIVSWLGVYVISALLTREKYHLKILVISLTIAGLLASTFFAYAFLTGKLRISPLHYGAYGLFSFSSRNMFGVYLASIVPIIIGGRSLFNNKSMHTFLFMVAVWFCVAIIATNSRVGISLLALICLLWFALLSKKAIAWLVSAVVMVYYFAPFVILRFKDIGFGRTITSNTILERFEFWRYGLDLIRAKPLLGHGLSNPFAFHNSYIQVAVELGLIGMVIFAMVLLFFIYKSFISFRNAHENSVRSLTGGCLISQIIIAVGMASENFYSGTAIMWMFWVSAGTVWATTNLSEEGIFSRISTKN